jgi:hypothetical protein
MSWQVAADAEQFFALAGGFLSAQAVENTILLTVAENQQR